jgi:hypothetical protein
MNNNDVQTSAPDLGEQPKPESPITCDSEKSFPLVFKDELRTIRVGRETVRRHSRTQIPEDTDSLAALCLSGGGLRSAIFCLGCLQALDKDSLIDKFDYLSTVSGGGYIGSWLSALIHRVGRSRDSARPIFQTVEKEEDKCQGREKTRTKVEPAALQFLRENSSYLTPQKGLFSGDTWALIALYLRNLVINWFVLIPLLGAFVVLPRLFHLFTDLLLRLSGNASTIILGCLTVIFAVTAAWYPTLVPNREDISQDAHMRNSDERQLASIMSLSGYLRWFLTPFLAWVLFLTCYIYQVLSIEENPESFLHAIASWMLALFGVANLVLLVLGYVFQLTQQIAAKRWRMFSGFLQTVGSLGMSGTLVYFAPKLFAALTKADHSDYFFVFSPCGLLAIYLISGTLQVAFADAVVQDNCREWWVRSAGYILFTLCFWLCLGSLSFIAPDVVAYFGRIWPSMNYNVLVGLVSTISGVIAFFARSDDSTGKSGNHSGKVKRLIRKSLFFMAMLVFVSTLLVVLSYYTNLLSNLIKPHFPGLGLQDLFVAVPLVAFSVLVSVPVNVNRFSAHSAYRNRLVRTFLGASHIGRKFNLFTGFSERDDIHLYELDSTFTSSESSCPAGSRLPRSLGRKAVMSPRSSCPIAQRPLHLICAAVNLQTGEPLAWQERRAASFTFSPLHCGSSLLGYRSSIHYGGPGGITLGTAMAISGAAANPGMGFYTSPLKSFLLTLLNARLGWWLGNPCNESTWKLAGPICAFGQLLAELLSLTNRRSRYINLSDGGHFDNTAVYEMIQRGCSHIFLVDADSKGHNMAQLARRVQVDFGVNLQLIPRAQAGFPFESYKIDYSDAKLPGESVYPVSREGTLLRVYPAIVEKECTFQNFDLANGDSRYPNDSLLNQFFTETLFEGYRTLGYDLTRIIMRPRVKGNNHVVKARVQAGANGVKRVMEGGIGRLRGHKAGALDCLFRSPMLDSEASSTEEEKQVRIRGSGKDSGIMSDQT